MKKSTFISLLIFTISIALFISSSMKIKYIEEYTKKENSLKEINDSLVKELSSKNKYIELQDSIYSMTKSKDSVKLYSIDKSIKTIYHELKNQTHHTFSIPDSSFSAYIHSIRANGGFYKIQY